MKPALCLFTDSLHPSGVGEHMMLLASELQHRYRVSLVCPPSPAGDSLLRRAVEMGIQTLALSVRSREDEAPLAAWLRENNVETFHCHAGIGWEGHHGIYAAHYLARIPVVVRTEHLPYLLTEAHQRDDHAHVVELTDCLISVSEEACASFVRAGVPEWKVRAVHNGVRLLAPTHAPAQVRKALEVSTQTPIILTVGRFSEQKGHRYLLEAIPTVLEQQPDALFLWVGDGELENALRNEARALGVQHAIRFLGRRDDVPNLLAASNAFVLPSLFEGLPLSVLEAMAAGLPVVGTRCCGTAEAVQDGVTGRLVEPRDVAALASAILEIVQSPTLAARWGEAGRARVQREFLATYMAERTMQIYEALRQQKMELVVA